MTAESLAADVYKAGRSSRARIPSPIARIRKIFPKELDQETVFAVAAMTILRLPDLVGPISPMETGLHPDEVEISQASSEWFGRQVTLPSLAHGRRLIKLSYDLMSQSRWNEMVKMEYGLCAARGYPSGDKKRLRLAADWITVLFNYDDLLDDSTSHLTVDEIGATAASKIMLSVFSETENFQPTPSLPVAATFHKYV